MITLLLNEGFLLLPELLNKFNTFLADKYINAGIGEEKLIENV